jgi:hypothetical protein
MQSAILCHAAADADFAHEIRRVLKLNCALAIDDKEGLIEPGCDLLDTAERALSADYLLLLLSPFGARAMAASEMGANPSGRSS